MIKIEAVNLKELINCDSEGRIFFLKRDPKWFKKNATKSAEWLANQWNAKFAGKECFTKLTKNGYLAGTIFNKKFLAHRVLFAWRRGYWPEYIDHKNGIRTDNRIENLQEVTWLENHKNQGLSVRNTSGFKGVTWHKKGGGWRFSICCNNVRKEKGGFPSAEAAYEAYCEEAKRLGFSDRHIYGEKE